MFCPSTMVGVTGATGAIGRCCVQAKQAARSVNFQPAFVMRVSVDGRAAEDIYRLCSLQATHRPNSARGCGHAGCGEDGGASRGRVHRAGGHCRAHGQGGGHTARTETESHRVSGRKKKKPTPFFFQIYIQSKKTTSQKIGERERASEGQASYPVGVRVGRGEVVGRGEGRGVLQGGQCRQRGSRAALGFTAIRSYCIPIIWFVSGVKYKQAFYWIIYNFKPL